MGDIWSVYVILSTGNQLAYMDGCGVNYDYLDNLVHITAANGSGWDPNPSTRADTQFQTAGVRSTSRT